MIYQESARGVLARTNVKALGLPILTFYSGALLAILGMTIVGLTQLSGGFAELKDQIYFSRPFLYRDHMYRDMRIEYNVQYGWGHGCCNNKASWTIDSETNEVLSAVAKGCLSWYTNGGGDLQWEWVNEQPDVLLIELLPAAIPGSTHPAGMITFCGLLLLAGVSAYFLCFMLAIALELDIGGGNFMLKQEVCQMKVLGYIGGILGLLLFIWEVIVYLFVLRIRVTDEIGSTEVAVMPSWAYFLVAVDVMLLTLVSVLAVLDERIHEVLTQPSFVSTLDDDEIIKRVGNSFRGIDGLEEADNEQGQVELTDMEKQQDDNCTTHLSRGRERAETETAPIG